MLKPLTFCVVIPFIAGCAVLSHGRETLPSINNAKPEIKAEAAAIVHREAIPRPPVATKVAPVRKPTRGVILGKTDFKGLLKAPYVRLLIVARNDPARRYYLYVGSRGNQSVVPWGEERFVEPGYFILQLPPGAYRISEIAIPVGSTMAEESIELDFDMIAGKAYYVGTLDVEGVKERVKFGGIPLVRPGFTYALSVRDEFSDALVEARTILPDAKIGLEKRLFSVVYTTNGNIPSADFLKPGGKR